MKRVNTLSLIVLLSFILYGCLPSLHPLYTEDTLIFDEGLIGKWYCEDGGIWSFVKTGDKEYGLKISGEDGKHSEYVVHLVQLGEHRFIDLFPGDNAELENTFDMYGSNLVPAHSFMKLDLYEPNLSLQWVYLGDIIDDDPNALKHERFDDDSILITAKPKDIQQVILQNLDEIIDQDGEPLKRCPSIFSVDNIAYDQQMIGLWESAAGEYIDIIEWGDNGYDVVFEDDSGDIQAFKAMLYTLNDHSFLGLYACEPSKEEIEAGLHLIPDVLVHIERVKSQLKIQNISWDEIQKLISENKLMNPKEFSESQSFFKVEQ